MKDEVKQLLKEVLQAYF